MSRELPNQDQKLKLAGYLQSALLEKFGTISEAARSVGILPRSLLNCLSRNRFYDDELQQLAPLVGLSAESLRRYDFQVIKSTARRRRAEVGLVPYSDNGDANRHFHELCQRTKATLLAIGSKSIVLDLYRNFACDSGDCALLLYLMGDEEVIEWTSPTAPMLSSILESLARNLKIVYLFPYRSEIRLKPHNLSESTEIFPLTRRRHFDIERGLVEFKSKLINTVKAHASLQLSGLTEEVIDGSIDVQFFSEHIPDKFPAFKHALMCHHLNDPLRYGRFANINITVHDCAQAEGEFGVILPCAESDVERLVRLTKMICTNETSLRISPLFRSIANSLTW